MVLLGFLVLSVAFVALTNGANANFKGVASLYGSGTTTLSKALWWGTICTFAGSMCALLLAQGLLKSFSGKGLVSDRLLESPAFTCAVAAGAALTSFIANRIGFPVSTTHALLGALIGAGIAAAGIDHVELSVLGKTFLYPLLFSPLLAVCLGAIAYEFLRSLGAAPDHRTKTLDRLHFASAGAASFARGINDTPKMAALLWMVPWLSKNQSILLVGVLIAIGALLDAKNVAETLGKKITDMNPGQGFAANLVTAILVASASFHSLPVSTTHVSVGALLGMGASTRQAKWKKVQEIILAWITTVPIAAMFAAMVYLILSWIPS
jgi:PiT family inorganic phosphate transporter